MSAVSRFERKYILNREEYYRIRNVVVPFFERDYYSVQGGGRYLVRSIYYDTRDYRAWYEKDDGNFGRIKLRLRSYSATREGCELVSVEIKTKSGNSMLKHSSAVSPQEYEQFVTYGAWPDTSDPVVCEFERLSRVRALVPVCLVEYMREGFAARDGSRVRLTFDHNVSSMRASGLFPDAPLLKPHRPKNIILEIKTRGTEPKWLHEMVRSQRLTLWPNSKYWQGIEVIRPNMVTPREVAP